MLKVLLVALAAVLPAAAHASDSETASNLAQTQLTQSAPKAEVEIADVKSISSTPLDPRMWITVRAKDSKARTALNSAGLDIVEIKGEITKGIISQSGLAALVKNGYEITSKTTLEQFNKTFSKDFPAKDATYHSYQEMTTELNTIASTCKEYCSVVSIGKSSEGRDVWALRFNPSAKGAAVSKLTGVTYMGLHHAREHLSAEIPLIFAKWLADNKTKADVKAVLDKRDIWIVPMVNPDGGEYDIATGQYRWWRKNTRKLSGSNIGVDLNRNYGHRWGGESSNPSSETYQGPSAFSEPESKVVKAFFDKYTNMKVMISYHTYGGMVLYPWGDADEDIPNAKDLAMHKAMAAKLADFTGYNAMKSSELYIATGDSCDWTYDAHKILSFTIELGPDQSSYGGFYPGAAMITKEGPKNTQAAFWAAQVADNPPQQ